MKKTVSVTILILLLTSIVTLAFNIQTSSAENTTRYDYPVTHIHQLGYEHIGRSCCGPTSITMLLRYYFPKSDIDVPDVYHSGTQAYNYHGPTTGYKDVSFVPADQGSPREINKEFEDYYHGDNSGMYPGAAAHYLNFLWGGQAEAKDAPISEVLSEIKEHALILNVWYYWYDQHGQEQKSGHYVVLRGYDDKGTPKLEDDIFHINDPVKEEPTYWNYKEFSERRYKGRIITFEPTLSGKQREYTVVVDNNHVQLDEISAKDAGGKYVWWEYYGLRDGAHHGDWYYPKQDGHWAKWVPNLPVDGNYEIHVIISKDNEQSNVEYAIYDSDDCEIGKKTVNQKGTGWCDENLGIFPLRKGSYVQIGNVPSQCNVDAVRFVYIGARDEWTYYHTYNEIELGLRSLESSGIAKVNSIGVSVEGRQIWAVKISDEPSVNEEDEPDVLFVGLHHAREWISAEVPYYLAVNLIQAYQSDESVKTLIDNSEIWIVPVLNPDGLEYSRTVDRMWRKNRKDNGDGTFGVDLNRNYGYMWGGSGSSGDTDSDTYRGPSAFSEPETIAIQNLIQDSTRDFQAVLSYHSYGQLILYPWGYTDESAPDSSVMSALATEMSDLILNVHSEIYTPQQSSKLYLTSGDLTDWVYGTTGVPAFTIELRPESSHPGFELPQSEILGTCEENWPAALYLIRWVVLSQGGFMDFEDGVDKVPIRSTIPGMMFTTTMGYDWVYGDIRTGLYNVNPYGSRAYECHGNLFAWLGPNQGSGRIDFTGATAESISMLTSTAYGTYLDAYDSSGSLLARSYAGPNIWTGTMSEIAVTASSIAYVIIHDTGNYWLIDDLRVSDLLRQTSAFQSPDATSMFQTLDTIDKGTTSTYEFTNDQQQTLKMFLNWQGSQLGIQIIRPDGTTFYETESDSPPIRIAVPVAEAGTWSIIVTAIDTPYDNYPFALDVASLPLLHDVDVQIDPQIIKVEPGQTAEYTINITNIGDVIDTYDLTLQGLNVNWFTFSDTTFLLDPGQKAQATLTISVPYTSLMLKDYPFTITATSQGDLSVSDTADAVVSVDFTSVLPDTPTGGLAVAVTPKFTVTSAGTEHALSVTVVNNENFDDAIWLNITLNGIPAAYQADLAWFSWTSVKVFVPAGSSITLQLTAAIPSETSTGYKIFRAEATSTTWTKGYAKDSGIIRVIE